MTRLDKTNMPKHILSYNQMKKYIWDKFGLVYSGIKPKGKLYKPNGKRECARRLNQL